MVNIKYFILLCVTFYSPTVKSSIEEKEIDDLWNAIKKSKNDFILYDDLIEFHEGKEPDVFRDIMNQNGISCSNCGGASILTYGTFKKLTLEGIMPIRRISVIRNLFEDISSEKNKLYITMTDLFAHYGTDIQEIRTINEVTGYGVILDREWRLYYDNFKRVLNLGLLLTPDTDWSD